MPCTVVSMFFPLCVTPVVCWGVIAACPSAALTLTTLFGTHEVFEVTRTCTFLRLFIIYLVS